MPSGHPKDPAAYHAKMAEARERRAASKQAENDEIRKLATEGLSNEAIASKMNIPESSIRAMLAPAPASKHIARKRTTKRAVAVTQKRMNRIMVIPDNFEARGIMIQKLQKQLSEYDEITAHAAQRQEEMAGLERSVMELQSDLDARDGAIERAEERANKYEETANELRLYLFSVLSLVANQK